MTKREKLASFRHAKQHAVEAITEVLTDEHHSILRVDGEPRRDMQAEVMRHLEGFLKQIKRAKLEG